MKIKECVTSATLLFLSFGAKAAEVASQAQNAAGQTGASMIWILANLSYAGMRAQGNSSVSRRILSFVFGSPGTFLSYLAVVEGGERAYGVDIPRRK